MTYLKAQIKWKRSHVLTTCNAIKMPVRIAACKLPQNRANMALTFFSPFITTQKKILTKGGILMVSSFDYPYNFLKESTVNNCISIQPDFRNLRRILVILF